MGSGLDKMYADYDDYQYICVKLGENVTRGFTEFRSHLDQVLKKHGFKSKYDYFDYLHKQEERDKKLDELLKG